MEAGPNAKQVGAVIRRLRKRESRSIEEFGGEAGIDPSHLSEVERGKRNIGWEKLQLIARELRVRPSELIRLAEEETSSLESDPPETAGVRSERTDPSDPSSPPSTINLGAAIRKLRVERQMKAEALAKGAGIHWTYLSGIEHGHRNPTWKILVSIATTLDVKIADLAQLAEAIGDEDGTDAGRGP